MDVAVQPATPVFGSNIMRGGDFPFRPWGGLTLEIDGQPETSASLLGLAAYLVRQALADVYPEKVERAADVELLLFGLKAHVSLEAGPVLTLGSRVAPPNLSETRVLPGLTIGNCLFDASEEGGASIAELYARLAPADGIEAALEHLREAGMEHPIQAVSALMPSMTIQLQPPYDEMLNLVYESKAVALKAQLEQAPNILDRLGAERFEIRLGDECVADDEPLYEVAEYLLEKMLRELEQRSRQSGQAGLESRVGEWDKLRLVVGSEVTCEPLFAFDPNTLQPVLPHATRSVLFAGMENLLLPEHSGVEVAERLWTALASEEAREEWRKVEGDDSLDGRSTLLRLNVQARLNVLKQQPGEASCVLESYTEAELFPEEQPKQAPSEPVETVDSAALLAATPVLEAETGTEAAGFALQLSINGTPWTEGGELEALCRRLALRYASTANVVLQPGHVCQLDIRSGDVHGLPVAEAPGQAEVLRAIRVGEDVFALENGPEQRGIAALYEQLQVDEHKALSEFASVDDGRMVPLILVVPAVSCRVLQDQTLVAEVELTASVQSDKSELKQRAWQHEAQTAGNGMGSGFWWIVIVLVVLAMVVGMAS